MNYLSLLLSQFSSKIVYLALILLFLSINTSCADDLILWNGEKENHGSGWVSPEGVPDLFFHVQEKVSYSSPHAVQFHFKAAQEWVECAWRWFPWFPPTAGTDFRPYQNIQFALKTSAPFPCDDLHVRLDSAPQGAKSKMLSLKKYIPSFSDGNWHIFTIPLQDFAEPGMTYDPRHAVELFFGARLENGAFELYLDDLKLTGNSKH